MFRKLFGFGRSDPLPNVDKTQAGDLENWTLNQELNRYEFTKNGYNYKRIPDILDPENRVTNDFYIKNAVEFTEIATYDLKGATVMIDGNLTVRAEVTILNGIIDLMYGTGTSGREHELKIDHDFTFNGGEFKHVYAIRHFLNGTDDDMLGTLADIHGLSKINDIEVSVILGQNGNPSLLKESLKVGNRSTDTTMLLKNITYHYELVLVQDSMDLDNCHIYGDTIELSSEDAAPKILSSANNASITCKTLKFSTKMTIKNVELHVDKITFANSSLMNEVGIEDCTLYNKLQLNADSIKLFRGNTVFVEGFCVQVEDNKNLEINMKMYNKGDLNGKNKMINNFVMNEGSSFEVVRKTLHNDFNKVYQTTGEYITEQLNEGKKYTADTYVNYDVYIQWLTECATKYGDFEISNYKIGNTEYTERKTVNEFITLLKSKTRVQEVNILKAGTNTQSLTFIVSHTTDNGRYYTNIDAGFQIQRDGDVFTNPLMRMLTGLDYLYDNSGIRITYYGGEVSDILNLRHSIVMDYADFFNYSTKFYLSNFRTFHKECEMLAHCKILLAYHLNSGTCGWLDIEDWLSYFPTDETSFKSKFKVDPVTSGGGRQALFVQNGSSWKLFDVLPIRLDLLKDDPEALFLMPQFFRLSSYYKEMFVERIKEIKPDLKDKRMMIKLNGNFYDFLTINDRYPPSGNNSAYIYPQVRLPYGNTIKFGTYDEYKTYSNYFYNSEDDSSSDHIDTVEKLFNTYYNMLENNVITEPTEYLKGLLNEKFITNNFVTLVSNEFSRYILNTSQNAEYYKCTLNNNGTEIEKSLLELDNVGSANSVTNVMTEHTTVPGEVPLHKNPQSFYTKVDGEDNVHYNIKTAEDVLNDVNNYLYINKLNVYWDNQMKAIIYTGQFRPDSLMQYLLEDQLYSGKKIILHLKRNEVDEWRDLDKIESPEQLMLSCFGSGASNGSSESYYQYLSFNKPLLSEDPLIPLHNAELPVIVTNASNQEVQVQVNTLDAIIEVQLEVGGTKYYEKNPWFEYYREKSASFIATKIQEYRTSVSSDMKKVKEYVLEIQYFLGHPLYFSNISGIYDLAHYKFEDTTINVIDPVNVIQNNIYARSNGDWIIVYNGPEFLEKTSALFELPLATEEHIDMKVGKELFNYVLLEILKNSWIDDPMPSEGDTYEAKYPSTFGLDITMREKNQSPEQAQTYVVDDIRKDIDTLFDKLKEYREEKYGTNGEMTCTVIFKNVRLYGTLEGKLPLHEKEFEFDIGGNIFLAIVRSFDKKIIVKDNENVEHEVDNPWFDRYIKGNNAINNDVVNYVRNNPPLSELKEYLIECEYYAGNQFFYSIPKVIDEKEYNQAFDIAYLKDTNINWVDFPYDNIPETCYVYNETLREWRFRYLDQDSGMSSLFSIPLMKEYIEERAKHTFELGILKLLENSKLKAENEEFPDSSTKYYNGIVESDIICNFEAILPSDETLVLPELYDEDVHLREVMDHLFDDIKNKYIRYGYYYTDLKVNIEIKDIIPYVRSTSETLHENMNIYEANGDTSVNKVAENDIKKYTTYTTEEEKKQYLNECLEKLPGNLEAFIRYRIGEVAEEPVYKFIRLQELLNGNKSFGNVPENLETLITVTDRFYQNILETDSLEYKDLENDAKDEKINTVITTELMNLIEYDIPIFLERAKQMIIFYCTKDNKMIKDILIHLIRSESIMIIRKGIKTIKLTEEPLDSTLLSFINTLESDNSIYPNITNVARGVLVEASSIYVMPKYITEEQASQEDTLISAFNSIQTSFDTADYQYGMEYPKYRYTQREIFTEIDEILNDKHIGVLASRRRVPPEEHKEEWKYNAYPYEDFIQMNTNIERNLHIFSMEVINDVTGTTMMNIKRTSSLDGVISTVEVTDFIDSWIVSRLLKRTNYPVENYDLEYTNDNDEKEIIRISDLVIKDGFEEVTQNEAYTEKRSFKMKAPFKLTKVENEYELPLIPEETSTADAMYDTLKDKAEDMTPEQFETYSKEYLDDMYSRARKAGIYIYFVHTIKENENTLHEVIPMSQTIEFTKENINDYELFSINPTVPEETITTIQDFKAKCVLNYEYVDNEEHRIGYSFYIGELMTLYAKKLQSQLIDNYKIQASIFQGSKLENNETILDYVDFGDFLIQQIKTNKVYKQIEFKDKANEVDFFSVWSPVNTTERSAVKELADMINLYLTNEIDMITLKLYFYEWQMKAAYLSYNEEDHSVIPSNEPSRTPVTFKLATSEIRSYTLKDLRGCCEGLTITCLLSLEDEQLREVLSTNTFINPYPYRIEQVSDIIDDGEDSEEENEEDIYILKDEDQNETRGWIYTGLIRRLIMKYLEGSLRGNETSWNNITSRTMMSNDEMSNIITLLNTRYNSENTKAQNIPELHNILEPAEGFGIIDALNLILDKEQTYNRENVKYSEEEISDILDSIERWYNYYEPDTKTFLNTADIMIWEGMELECHTDITSFESRADLIVEDYKKIHNKFNNTPTKDLVAIGANGTTVKFNVRRYRPIQDSEWLQLINEMQGIRNAWQSVPGTEDNRVLLCIGSNYGEIWSVFGRQPGTDLPLETYLYLKNQTTSTGSSRTNTLEITNNVIYIPKDRENSDLIWDVDKYFHTNMYQLLLYPYYAMINDTSKFKDFINPILANNPQEVVIEYLGYIVMVPKTSGQSAHKH